MKGDYEELHALKRRKNKPNSKPISRCRIGRGLDSRLRGNDKQQISVLIRVNPVEMECYLKKQSQCQYRQYSINLVMVRFYGDNSRFLRFWAAKNKAKQSQYAGLRPEILSTKL